MTLDEAKGLHYRQTLYDKIYRNHDGTPARWRVNGKVKTWKHDLNRIEIPIKRGLYETHYLTEKTIKDVSLTEEEAKHESK